MSLWRLSNVSFVVLDCQYPRDPLQPARKKKTLRVGSPSKDRGRGPRPVWGNPNSQLPGTGVEAGFESGLYGTPRRRDHSVPERTRLRTSQSEGVSTGSTADGSAALPSPRVHRPSLT